MRPAFLLHSAHPAELFRHLQHPSLTPSGFGSRPSCFCFPPAAGLALALAFDFAFAFAFALPLAFAFEPAACPGLAVGSRLGGAAATSGSEGNPSPSEGKFASAFFSTSLCSDGVLFSITSESSPAAAAGHLSSSLGSDDGVLSSTPASRPAAAAGRFNCFFFGAWWRGVAQQ